MSQYATIKTRIKDRHVLIECLRDMGLPVEEGSNLSLSGYEGDSRLQTADIVIRRKYLGSASNDIGFRKVGDHYDLIISNYDRRERKGQEIMGIEKKVIDIQNRIMRKYAEERVCKTMEQFKRKGFKLRKRTEEGKRVVYEYVKIT